MITIKAYGTPCDAPDGPVGMVTKRTARDGSEAAAILIEIIRSFIELRPGDRFVIEASE